MRDGWKQNISRIVYQRIKFPAGDALHSLGQGYHVLFFGHIKIQDVDVAGLEMLAFLMGEEGGDNGEVAEDELLRQSMADASITAPTFWNGD